MSTAIDLVRRINDVFRADGPEATAEFLAEDLRWFPGLVVDDAVAVRGRDAYLAHHAALRAAKRAVDVEEQTYEDLGGGRVLVTGELIVRGPGVETRQDMCWVMTVTDDLVTSIAAHPSRDEALRSVGKA